MNTKNFIYTVTLSILISCQQPTKPDTVTDIDGNIYPTVTIANKVWMAQDLRVTRYRNGDHIPLVTDTTAWKNSSTGACCYYNNDTAYINTQGLLYNWHVINDPRLIAPAGWHVPTNEEINILVTWLQNDTASVAKLKLHGLGGYRFFDGNSYHTFGFNGYWWSATRSFELYDHSNRLFTGFADVQRNAYEATNGLAIRCVKD